MEMEMDWGPETADAVVTCASPLPVAHPVRPDWLATGGESGGQALLDLSSWKASVNERESVGHQRHLLQKSGSYVLKDVYSYDILTC